MIKINGHSQHAFTTLITGNDGEEQLILVCSSGQHGKTNVTAVRAQVDGHTSVLVTSQDFESFYKEGSTFRELLTGIIVGWVDSGTNPTDVELAVEMEKVKDIVDSLC